MNICPQLKRLDVFELYMVVSSMDDGILVPLPPAMTHSSLPRMPMARSSSAARS